MKTLCLWQEFQGLWKVNPQMTSTCWLLQMLWFWCLYRSSYIITRFHEWQGRNYGIVLLSWHAPLCCRYCYDRKSQAACAQSYAPWQQATRDHARNLSSRTLVIMFNRSHVNIGRATTSQSLLLLLARATHMMVLFFTHIQFVVNHTFNTTPPEMLQQHPLLFTTNRTNRTFFVWRLNSTRPSRPGHNTILLRSEILSGMSTKLRTVTASNNRVHMPWSLYYCLFAPHICMVLFFTHIPFVVNHTFNATPPERLQEYSALTPINYWMLPLQVVPNKQ